MVKIVEDTDWILMVFMIFLVYCRMYIFKALSTITIVYEDSSKNWIFEVKGKSVEYVNTYVCFCQSNA